MDKVGTILETEPLSKALRRALVLANNQGSNELVQWIHLELDGYYGANNAMNDSVIVPEYRTLSGVHFNDFGQRLQVEPHLAFINELRTREGVEVLESLKDRREGILLQDTYAANLIAEHLNVQVSAFYVDRCQIIGVLSHIRSELARRLQLISADEGRALSKQGKAKGDVLVLTPNFYGLGIDLRALWNRVKPKKEL